MPALCDTPGLLDQLLDAEAAAAEERVSALQAELLLKEEAVKEARAKLAAAIADREVS